MSGSGVIPRPEEREPVTHYSPNAAKRLIGDIHGTLACGAFHWGFVADDWALVTCEPCKATQEATMPP